MSALQTTILVACILVITAPPGQGMPFHPVPCCTKLAKRIPKNLLQQVTKVRFQKNDGICSLKAIVLHVEDQQRCMDPNNRALQAWVKKNQPNKHL
ncbi:C-C motif chemokine 27 [Pseudophryne corroboree]|uniref:C-C motif chemokine 27 n=1 Tax=Pseudophryne corroboree TaxID=495146 RepID=UPI00308193F5